MAWLGKKAMQQMGKRMERSAGFNPFQSQQTESEKASKQTSEKPKEKKVVGEYVDFEEID